MAPPPPHPDIAVVDSHHHLWDLSRLHYPWLSGPTEDPADQTTLGLLQRNYELADYLSDVRPVAVGAIHVEAGHDPSSVTAETRWLEEILEGCSLPVAIVANAFLEDDDLPRVLDAHEAATTRLRGIRQMLDVDTRTGQVGETSKLNDPRWLRGLGELQDRGLSFDVQIRTTQLAAFAATAHQFPGMSFVVNHGGYHHPRDARLDEVWLRGLEVLSEASNVSIKSSAYAAVDPAWDQRGVDFYVGALLRAFGPQRVMFGSNFPVDRRSTSYDGLIQAHRDATTALSPAERDDYFVGNARRAYRI